MLALEDVTITKKSFKFKAYTYKAKNMLVLSLVRILWERFGMMSDKICPNHDFLKSLQNDKCKYKNKLARFCYFYKKIKFKSDYFHNGHIWNPSKTKIRYTKEFTKTKITDVNNFFYGKY